MRRPPPEVFFFEFAEQGVHPVGMVEGIVVEILQYGYPAQLVLDVGGQVPFDLPAPVFDLFHDGSRILYLEKAEVYPGFQEVGRHFYGGKGDEPPIYHAESQALEDIAEFLHEQGAYLFLSFTFLHTLTFFIIA
jgi:hypothetical protein